VVFPGVAAVGCSGRAAAGGCAARTHDGGYGRGLPHRDRRGRGPPFPFLFRGEEKS
jgi:hypothetical protein